MFALGPSVGKTFSVASARKFHAGRSIALYALKVGDKAPNFTLKDQVMRRGSRYNFRLHAKSNAACEMP